MKCKAAVAWEPNKPLQIEEVEVEGSREGEVSRCEAIGKPLLRRMPDIRWPYPLIPRFGSKSPARSSSSTMSRAIGNC